MADQPTLGSIWQDAARGNRIQVLDLRPPNAVVANLDGRRTRLVNLARFRPHRNYRSGWVYVRDLGTHERASFDWYQAIQRGA